MVLPKFLYVFMVLRGSCVKNRTTLLPEAFLPLLHLLIIRKCRTRKLFFYILRL